MSTVEVVEGVPSAEEYRRLRGAVGWPSPSAQRCAQAMANTVFGVLARRDGVAVGMARVIGDTGVYLLVVDVLVSPAEQGKGVGALLMDRVARWLADSGAPHIALAADPAVAGFYPRWGFRLQDTRYMRLPRSNVL